MSEQMPPLELGSWENSKIFLAAELRRLAANQHHMASEMQAIVLKNESTVLAMDSKMDANHNETMSAIRKLESKFEIMTTTSDQQAKFNAAMKDDRRFSVTSILTLIGVAVMLVGMIAQWVTHK